MELVKKTDDYVIFQKSSKRYAVRDSSRKWISGDEKVKILVSEKLLDIPMPKAKPAEEAPEAAAEETPAAEAAAEEAAAE
ncbi:MAG: hypothetical protein KDD66_13795 [Bdellovibrionales bacterium]|nr:hypothetical protein [Bdellovibrionales bacterium]